MATRKQIEANRLNAQKSTGPKTPEGKRRSAMNALKHGLRSKLVVIPGEDPRDYETLRDRVIDDLQPDGAVQEILARQLIDDEWRLLRIKRLENAVVRDHLSRQLALKEQFDGLPDDDPEEFAQMIDCLAGRAYGNKDMIQLLQHYRHYKNAFARALRAFLDLRQSGQPEIGQTNPIDVDSNGPLPPLVPEIQPQEAA